MAAAIVLSACDSESPGARVASLGSGEGDASVDGTVAYARPPNPGRDDDVLCGWLGDETVPRFDARIGETVLWIPAGPSTRSNAVGPADVVESSYRIVDDEVVVDCDIVLGTVDAMAALQPEMREVRGGRQKAFAREARSIDFGSLATGLREIRWRFDQSVKASNRPTVLASIEDWNRRLAGTGVSLVRDNDLRPRHSGILFLDGSGSSPCRSEVGIAHRVTRLHLDEQRCYARAIIDHELGHALGLFHEQQRFDSDESEHHFLSRVTGADFDQLDTKPRRQFGFYVGSFPDVNSVMQYGGYAGALEIVDGSDSYVLPTMYDRTRMMLWTMDAVPGSSGLFLTGNQYTNFASQVLDDDGFARFENLYVADVNADGQSDIVRRVQRSTGEQFVASISGTGPNAPLRVGPFPLRFVPGNTAFGQFAGGSGPDAVVLEDGTAVLYLDNGVRGPLQHTDWVAAIDVENSSDVLLFRQGGEVWNLSSSVGSVEVVASGLVGPFDGIVAHSTGSVIVLARRGLHGVEIAQLDTTISLQSISWSDVTRLSAAGLSELETIRSVGDVWLGDADGDLQLDLVVRRSRRTVAIDGFRYAHGLGHVPVRVPIERSIKFADLVVVTDVLGALSEPAFAVNHQLESVSVMPSEATLGRFGDAGRLSVISNPPVREHKRVMPDGAPMPNVIGRSDAFAVARLLLPSRGDERVRLLAKYPMWTHVDRQTSDNLPYVYVPEIDPSPETVFQGVSGDPLPRDAYVVVWASFGQRLGENDSFVIAYDRLGFDGRWNEYSRALVRGSSTGRGMWEIAHRVQLPRSGFHRVRVFHSEDDLVTDNDVASWVVWRPTSCGDGTPDYDEECDDGNVDYYDGCTPGCVITPPGVCGDGVTQIPHEDCDDGNLFPGDGCDETCGMEFE